MTLTLEALPDQNAVSLYKEECDINVLWCGYLCKVYPMCMWLLLSGLVPKDAVQSTESKSQHFLLIPL